MIGPKITTVFRSRWNALFWSAGVLATAYCSIPAPDDDTGSPDQDKAVEQVAAVLKAQQSAN